MNRFVEKAKKKLDKLSNQQILTIFDLQNQQLKVQAEVLDSIDQGLFILNPVLDVLYFNKSFSILAEKNKSLIFNSDEKYNISLFFKSQEIINFLKETIKSKEEGLNIVYSRNKKEINTIIRIDSLKYFSNDTFLFSIRDITFLKELEEQFKKNESLAAMTTMAAGVAHEIKNPLASISIYIQLLQKYIDKNGFISKEDAQQSINVISDEIERLNKIAVDFLFAVRPLNPNMKLADLKETLEKTYKIVKAESDINNISLKLDISNSLPKAFIDSSMIEQCLLNLIRNSIQAFNNTKRESKNIIIRAHTDGNYIKIEVNDNGIGMTEEQQKHIFEPYYTTKDTGTGLGLTTILKIMKEHNGEITVNSTYNEGSTFILKLPVPSSERFRIGD